jgi:uncharacterized tellurite resistance protein B-like protein
MGFFSKLFSSEPVKLTIYDERDAYAAILLACMNSDGNMSEEEKTAFYTALANRPFFAGRDVIETVTRAANNLDKAGGSAALIDMAASSITETTRIPLFTNCVDMILSDGQVTPDEEKILEYLKTLFSIDDVFAGKCVEVLIAKNRI